MDTLLSYRDLEARGFGSRVTIWRKIKNGKFPEPVDYDGQPRWKESDIKEFLDSLSTHHTIAIV